MLQEACQQQQYNRGIEDLELWLSEIEVKNLTTTYIFLYSKHIFYKIFSSQNRVSYNLKIMEKIWLQFKIYWRNMPWLRLMSIPIKTELMELKLPLSNFALLGILIQKISRLNMLVSWNFSYKTWIFNFEKMNLKIVAVQKQTIPHMKVQASAPECLTDKDLVSSWVHHSIFP